MKYNDAWRLMGLALIIPTLGYILVNFYWWLFDGNTIITSKMMWAVLTHFLGHAFYMFATPKVIEASQEEE